MTRARSYFSHRLRVRSRIAQHHAQPGITFKVKLGIVLSASLLSLLPSSAQSQTPPPAHTLLMMSLDLLPPPINGQIIGSANPADPNKWPATFVFRNTDGQGCTATAVGDRVILTAAHCIENGAVGTIQIGATFTSDVICQHHPNYPDDFSADFALCEAGRLLPSISFERLDTTSTGLVLGASVTLLGYGCRLQGGGDRNFGQLYEGESSIADVSRTNLYLRTRGGAALCFGDSGGGAYASTGPGNLLRRLIAVNSKGDISTNSWLSVTSKQTFIEWAKSWSATRNAQICGIHPEAQNCRQ